MLIFALAPRGLARYAPVRAWASVSPSGHAAKPVKVSGDGRFGRSTEGESIRGNHEARPGGTGQPEAYRAHESRGRRSRSDVPRRGRPGARARRTHRAPGL